MKTTSGEEISTIEIKKILEKIIQNENKRKPETDEKLVKILNEKGYKIARRTVAKYTTPSPPPRDYQLSELMSAAAARKIHRWTVTSLIKVY